MRRNSFLSVLPGLCAIGVIIALAIGLIFFRPASDGVEKATASTKVSSATAFKELIQGYRRLHTWPANWWLDHAPADTKEMEGLIVKLQRRGVQVQDIIVRYRSVAELTRSIAERFPTQWISFFHDGISQAVFEKGNEALNAPQASIEICFIPKSELQGHPSSLYYKREWNALMIAGLDWPEKVLPAVVLHELGHALAAKQGRASARAASGSDSYVQEELEMHGLETRVLWETSGGAYLEASRVVSKRLGPFASRGWEDLLGQVTLEDLKSLDASLGCEHCGHEVAGVLLAQYLLDIGRLYNAGATDVAEQNHADRELYRWLTSQSNWR